MEEPLQDERVRKIPLLSVNAGPRDGDEWAKRLKVFSFLISFFFSVCVLLCVFSLKHC